MKFKLYTTNVPEFSGFLLRGGDFKFWKQLNHDYETINEAVIVPLNFLCIIFQ